MKKYFCVCVGLVPVVTNATWHVWKPTQSINVSGDIVLPAGVTKGSFYFTSQLSYGSGQVLDEDCSNASKQGSKWFYLAIPQKVNVGNHGAYLSFSMSNDSFQWNSSSGGFNIYHKWDSYTYKSIECFGVGFNHSGVVYNWGSPKVDVILNNESELEPGEYTVGSTFGYVFREDRGLATDQANNSAINNLIQNAGVNTLVIKLDYTPQCIISISDISLDLGVFTPAEADGRVSNSIPFSVSCDKKATVEIGLKGANSVIGKTENYTDCENNNMCEIVFSDGLSYQKKLSNVTSINESVKVILHTGSPKYINPGAFSGEGILTMYFQ